jgi:hypothetical protein
MTPVVLSFTDGEVGVTLGALYRYIYTPIDLTIIYVTVSPNVNDADMTIDIDDDGTNVITAIDCSDVDVPGRWRSVHVGGTNAPVFVAAGSKLALDANSAAANTVAHVSIWALPGQASA